MLLDEDVHRNAANKRSASSIIILCAIAVCAVVLVHRESAVGGVEDVVGEAPETEIMLFQNDGSKVKSPKKHPGEAIHLEVQDTLPVVTPEDGEVDDPVTDDTLAPVHASWTGNIEAYSKDGFDSTIVSLAGAAAKKALAKGATEAEAFKKAQEAATAAVVKGSAMKGDSPAFSRTIKAAAYAAEMKALTEFEAGHTAEDAKAAASVAATSLVRDRRAVTISVPVPDTLEELLNNVDHLWGRTKDNLLHLKTELDKMPVSECKDNKETASASHQEMKHAILAASEHIAKGHAHKVAMDVQLLQAEATETEMKTAANQKQMQKLNEKATQSKQASAELHEHAKQQAHLAEGFLALASKHHSVATDAATHCKAIRMLAKFGYAQNQMKHFEAYETEQLAKKRQEAEEEKLKAQNLKEIADAESLKAKQEEQEAAMRTETAKLVSAMEISLSAQMTSAAKKAAAGSLEAHHLTKSTKTKDVATAAKAAAVAACTLSMKHAAKKLAENMSVVAKKHGVNAKVAMTKAIVTVLNVGRPLEEAIVSTTVAEIAERLLAEQKEMQANRKTKALAALAKAKAEAAEKGKALDAAHLQKLKSHGALYIPPKPVKAPVETSKPEDQTEPNAVHRLNKVLHRTSLQHTSANDIVTEANEEEARKTSVKAAAAAAAAQKNADALATATNNKIAKRAADKLAKAKAALKAKVTAAQGAVTHAKDLEKKESDSVAGLRTIVAAKKAMEVKVKKAANGAKKNERMEETTLDKKAAAQKKKEEKDAAEQAKAKAKTVAAEKKANNLSAEKKKADAEKKKAAAEKAAAEKVSLTPSKSEATTQAQKTTFAAKKLADYTLTKEEEAKKAANKPSEMLTTHQGLKATAVQRAAEAMSDAVTKATAKAAEAARKAVAAQGGTVQQQLQAAASAAAIASTKAAAMEASRLKKQHKVANVERSVPLAAAVPVKQVHQVHNKQEEEASLPPNMDMKGAMEKVAYNTMHNLMQKNLYSEDTIRTEITNALKPMIGAKVNHAASLAAAAAGKAAAAKGMSQKEVKLIVVKSAQQAAMKAKAQGKYLAKIVIGNAMQAHI